MTAEVLPGNAKFLKVHTVDVIKIVMLQGGGLWLKLLNDMTFMQC